MVPVRISQRIWGYVYLVVVLCGFRFQWKNDRDDSPTCLQLASAFDISLKSRTRPSGLHWSRHRPKCCIRSRLTKLYSSTIVDPESVLDIEDVDQLTDLVDKRSRARWDGNFQAADDLLMQIQAFPLPVSYHVLLEDKSRKLGGGSTWTIVREENFEAQIMDGPTILHLAHAALGLAIEASMESNLKRARAETSDHLDESEANFDNILPGFEFGNEYELDRRIESLVDQAKCRLRQQPEVLQYELNGRKSVDAAYWFALAGVTDEDLYQQLAEIATNELSRFGFRASWRSKFVHQILARLSAAGLKQNDRLVEVATQCLIQRSQNDEPCDENGFTFSTNDNSESPIFDLHSDRSLLMIWKFSTKQKKQGVFLQSALKHWEQYTANTSIISRSNDDDSDDESHIGDPPKKATCMDWNEMFNDPTRPLILDIGCGMGVSLLGLATCDEDSPMIGCKWSDCNLLGVDCGMLGIRYARSLAKRWGIDSRLQYVVDTAEQFLCSVKSYPGPVLLCLIQFPTPYRLEKTYLIDGEIENQTNMDDFFGGNSQLPKSADDGFMVSNALLDSVRGVLLKSRGKLLLQSNCEDVAVWMRNAACNDGRYDYVVDNFVPSWKPNPNSSSRIPQRTSEWISMGGERAEGPGWMSQPVLPRQGATETEVACILNGTPVHRCLLVPRQ